MFVEDFLEAIEAKIAMNHKAFGGLFDRTWYSGFIANVTPHVRAGRTLSSNQSRMILKMIEMSRVYLIEYNIATDFEITNTLQQPEHRYAPYESSNVPREVRYLGNNLLAFRSKANQVLSTAIKQLGKPPIDPSPLINPLRSSPRFDWTHRIWIVPVMRYNLHEIRNLILNFRFQVDAETDDYLLACKRGLDQDSVFVMADGQTDILHVTVPDDYILAAWTTEIAGGIPL